MLDINRMVKRISKNTNILSKTWNKGKKSQTFYFFFFTLISFLEKKA